MPKKYTDDVKKRAVEIVVLAQSNPDTSYGAITRIVAQFDVKTDTLRTWIRLHGSTGQSTAAESVDLAAENRRLRAELAESQRVNEILKKASAFSQRSSTANRPCRQIHRRVQKRLRNRADHPCAGRHQRTDCRVVLLRP